MNPMPTLSPEFADLLESLCLGEITTKEAERLEVLALSSDENCRHFVVFLHMHALAERFLGADAERETKLLEAQLFSRSAPAPSSLPLVVPLPASSSIHANSGFFSTAYHGTTNFFSQEIPFACLMSTIIVGFALVLASFITKEHYTQMPGQSVASVERSYSSGGAAAGASDTADKPIPSERAAAKSPWIGEITGKVDCVWANNKTAPAWHKFGMNDKFELKSGLVEITYYSGAKVILQGPCTYEVDSAAGGYLSLGKLTARVEKKGEGGGRKAEAANLPSLSGRGAGGEGVELPMSQTALTPALSQRVREPDTSPQPPAPNPSSLATSPQPLATNSNPQSPIPNSSPSPQPLAPSPSALFAVRTPTAVVTDLGTEFGVEVDESGDADVHVLSGLVEAKSTVERFAGQTWRLQADEAMAFDDEHPPAQIALDRKEFSEPLSIMTSLRKQDAPRPGTLTITDLGPTAAGLAGKLQADDDLQRAFAAGTASMKLVGGPAFHVPEYANVSRLCDAQNDSIFYGPNDGSSASLPVEEHMFIAPNDEQMAPAVYDIRFGSKYAGSRDLHEINIFHGPNTTRSPYDFDVLYSTARYPNVFRPLASFKDYFTQNGTLLRIECKPGEVADLSAIRLVIRPILHSTWIGSSFAEIDMNFHHLPAEKPNENEIKK